MAPIHFQLISSPSSTASTQQNARFLQQFIDFPVSDLTPFSRLSPQPLYPSTTSDVIIYMDSAWVPEPLAIRMCLDLHEGWHDLCRLHLIFNVRLLFSSNRFDLTAYWWELGIKVVDGLKVMLQEKSKQPTSSTTHKEKKHLKLVLSLGLEVTMNQKRVSNWQRSAEGRFIYDLKDTVFIFPFDPPTKDSYTLVPQTEPEGSWEVSVSNRVEPPFLADWDQYSLGLLGFYLVIAEKTHEGTQIIPCYILR